MKEWVVFFLFSGLLASSLFVKPVKSSRTVIPLYQQLIPASDSLQFDGPYVSYTRNQIFVRYLLQAGGERLVKTDSTEISQKQNLVLKVATDIPGEFFSVQLKSKLSDEKDSYKASNKMLILSDIEGNFAAFRKLLQSNGVIDKDLNWIFGNGQLVLVGDFFDRGVQVTELLWFIYALEEKAKTAGGYLHFVLGNHEIMNLTNDLRYLNPKYLDNAALLGEKYISLYAANTEIGRWLRTKNIVERIGKLLFLHAGISSDMNTLAIPLRDINRLARPYYADTSYNYDDKRLNFVMGDLGPFWYRGYYTGQPAATEPQIDSTLNQFDVKHIVTGHSVVADTVSAWYHYKVYNTDTHHAGGKSEAILVDGDNYYRVNATGQRTQLRTR